MNKVQIEEAISFFNQEFEDRYEIKSVFSFENDIICVVDTISYIACIPPYYLGYRVVTRGIESMRDFI